MEKDNLSPGVRILRRVVIFMGFLLVIGTVALFIAVYFKFMHKQQNSAPQNDFAAKPPQIIESIEKCIFKESANIEIENEIINSNLNGNILTIITGSKIKPTQINKIQQGNSLVLTASTQPSPQQIVIYDLCKGTVLSRLNILTVN